MGKNNSDDLSRRDFLKSGAAVGVGASALASAPAGAQADRQWDQTADFITIGAGFFDFFAIRASLDPISHHRWCCSDVETRSSWRLEAQ